MVALMVASKVVLRVASLVVPRVENWDAWMVVQKVDS